MSSKVAFPAIPLLVALFLGVGVAVAAVDPGKVSSECIGPEAVKAVSACPSGPKQFTAKKKIDAAFKSKPPPREVKAEKDFKPVDPTQKMDAGIRDQRKTRLKARAKALLITEITGLERLYKRTSKRSPDRPQLIRRLAEGYVELESSAQREKITAEIQAQDAGKKNPGAASKHRAEAAQANKIVLAARQNAIRYYSLMAEQYPRYSKIDEVLYYLAYEHEQGGDYKNARKVYFDLIQKAPQSEYIPNAYLAFGELYFQEAQADPSKWELAAQAYKEVIKYPPPKNKVYGYARYKLAYVHWNQGDYVHALNEFKKVIEYGGEYAQLPNALQLAKAARRDLIPVYAASGDPVKAYNFFKPLSGDKGGDQVKTIEMLNELGFAYIDTGHYKQAIALYKDLLSRDKGNKFCFYQGQITIATQALYSGNKDKVVEELDQQLRVRKTYGEGDYPEKDKLACANKTAELLSETAMSWHLEAVGSGGVRGTGDQRTMDLAAALYKKVTENFTAQDFENYQFPRIVKSDWPTMYKIRYAMADLLYFQQRWKDCGPAFDAVVELNPKGDSAAEAAYASVLCYQKMYDQLHAGDSDRKGKGLGPKGASKEDQTAKAGEWEKFKPKPLNETQQGMIKAFNRYVCYITPPKGDAEAEEQYVEVKYGRARIYFEAQHWEEAALGFRDVALNHSNKDAGIFAAQLYLEAINVLGSRAEPPRPTCFDDMGKDVDQFLELYCKGSKFEDNKEQCEIFTRIQFDIKRLKAEKTVELADSTSEKGNYAKALDQYRDGAEAYLALWREYCETPLSRGEKVKQCDRADEILYNMAKAYQAGRLLAKSIQARKILLSPKYGLHETELAKKAAYEIGQNYQAIAVYDLAADFFEKYAKDTNYKGEFADQALSDAALLRLGLGQDDRAIQVSKDFNRYYGRKKGATTAQLAFAIGAHYGSKKDWANVRRQLAGSMGLIDKNATLDVRIQAHALLGRAYVELKTAPTARREFSSVVGLWKDPNAAKAEIMSIPDQTEAARIRSLGRALEGIGEGLFYFAEEKKAAVDRVKFPEYRGPGSKEKVLEHINTKVKAWIQKKKPLIDTASAEYKKIVDLQPEPPPRWVISAGQRVGDMWGTFVREFRAAPIPDYMKKDYELRTAYFGALDEASEPLKLQAKSAYMVCLSYSVKYQYFDEFSRACEEWLAENYKAEFHLIDEFRGAPNRSNSALQEQARPLRLGGEPLIAKPEAEPPPPKAKEEEKDKEKEK